MLGGFRGRWRSAAPLWGDTSFASVAPALAQRMRAWLPSARRRVGMPIEPRACAPFTDGQWPLSHNGVVDRARCPLTAKAEIDGRQRALAALISTRGVDQLGDAVVKVAASDPTPG